MNDLISKTLEATPVVVERVRSELPATFPEHVFDAITNGLARSARTLANDAR